jgi:GTP-binding protein
VGKSCLFNRILGKRVAVVDDMPGVTRDRHYHDARWNGLGFMLVDTGGLDDTSTETMARAIAKQVGIACEESDILLFLVDATVGVTEPDAIISRRLRKLGRDKVLLVINKVESKRAVLESSTFVSLGLGEGMAVSALHGRGVGDLLDAVCGRLKAVTTPVREAMLGGNDLKIAIVGRPNAGKSSLVNKLLGDERMIVSSAPGTTRDSIDTAMDYNGKTVVLIDTAGLRKKANVTDDVEYHCNVRALESIRRCDIAVLMVDATQGIEEQDLKIVRHILTSHKGILICWNKWDIRAKDHKTFDHLAAECRRDYMELRNVPMVSVSALTGQRVTRVLDGALQIKTRMESPVQLDDFRGKVHEWIRAQPHPVTANKLVKIVSCDQLRGRFPLFRFFATNAINARESYKRYLANKIYETYDFDGCPVVVEFKNISKKRKAAGSPAAVHQSDN